jgi:PIN domain nuclease of toxin-antitoxin system
VIVLDASALLALTFDERGADRVATAIDRGASMSTVNLAECVAVVAMAGLDADELQRLWRHGPIRFLEYDADQAAACGILAPMTRRLGLSLGDRACLTLARALRAPALTADRAWKTLDLDIEIQLVR